MAQAALAPSHCNEKHFKDIAQHMTKKDHSQDTFPCCIKSKQLRNVQKMRDDSQTDPTGFSSSFYEEVDRICCQHITEEPSALVDSGTIVAATNNTGAPEDKQEVEEDKDVDYRGEITPK